MRDGKLELSQWFALREELDPQLEDRSHAVKRLRALGRAAVQKRMQGEPRAGLYLSGGIDSSAVGALAGARGRRRAGVQPGLRRGERGARASRAASRSI